VAGTGVGSIVYKRDLVDPKNDGEVDVILMCPNKCGVTYSADLGDYWNWDEQTAIKCDDCDVALILVRKVITYEEL